jgi:uncharacterized protein YhfF
MTIMKNRSTAQMWADFLTENPVYSQERPPREIIFWDEPTAANKAANLVLSGIKKASCHSLLLLQLQKRPLPKIGDHSMVCNWEGEPQCIIRTTAVKLVPFFSIREAFVQVEGEGHRGLASWKETHWELYERQLEPYGRNPSESMIVVCDYFEKVF